MPREGRKTSEIFCVGYSRVRRSVRSGAEWLNSRPSDGGDRSAQDEFAMHDVSRRTIVRLALLVTSFPLAAAMPSRAGQRTELAIAGYDPVAYFTEGKPTRGLPEIEYEWDEHRYRFSRAEHRELFKADPVRYAPQFSNFCAMALARGEVVEANPEHWLISSGRLYLFGLPKGPSLFRQNLSENIDKADWWDHALVKKQ